MMREKETNKFRGMAFVDVPDGSVWKALNLHKTYFNGRMINVEETKDGGKHSAVGHRNGAHGAEEEGLHQPHAEPTQQADAGAERGFCRESQCIDQVRGDVPEDEEGEGPVVRACSAIVSS